MPRAKLNHGTLEDGTKVTSLDFECPGCGRWHGPRVAGPNAWEWNGDLDLPTVSPSLLARWSEGEDGPEQRCHSYVRAGQIQFLEDCTHAFARQTLDLLEQ